MVKKLCMIMDNMAGIQPHKDTSVRLLLEAQARGWQIASATTADLRLDAGRPLAHATMLRVTDAPAWSTPLARTVQDLTTLDLILVRKDPPFDQHYLYATHVLDWVAAQGVTVINAPRALRDLNEKLSILQLPQCAPPTQVSADIEHIKALIVDYGKAVLKPLHGMGGHDVYCLTPEDVNAAAIITHLTVNGTTAVMVQPYLDAISAGDKRMIMLDYEPLPVVLARLPAPGSFRANLAAGGRGVAQPLSAHDRWICDQVSPLLAQHGIRFAGLDVIGDYLTEINITSPTCLRELEAAEEKNFLSAWFATLERG